MLLYNIIGYFAAFHLVQAEWRSYVRQQLYSLTKAENVVLFTFSKANFDNSQQELIKNGRFYDVIKYEIKGDQIIVYCFDDSTETQLTAQFQQVLGQNINQKTDFSGKTQHLLSSLVKEYIFDSSFSIKTPPSVYRAKKSDFSFHNRLHLHLFHLIEAPPPKSIV